MIYSKKYCLLTILLLFYSCNTPDISFSQAKTLIEEKRYSKAIEILNKIVDKQPTFDSAYLARAHAFEMIGNTDEAFRDYDLLIAISSNLRIRALEKRATLYYKIQKYENSINDLTKVISLDQNNYHAFYTRGILKMGYRNFKDDPFVIKTGDLTTAYIPYDYQSALNDFNATIAINPGFADVYSQRGKIFEDLGKKDSAIHDYNTAISLDSNNFDAYLQRGIFYMTANRNDQALSDFEKAITIKPNDPIPYINRGELKKTYMNDKKGACADFKKAEQLGFQMSEENKQFCDY